MRVGSLSWVADDEWTNRAGCEDPAEKRAAKDLRWKVWEGEGHPPAGGWRAAMAVDDKQRKPY